MTNLLWFEVKANRLINVRQQVRETEIDTSLLQGTIRHSAGAVRALRQDNHHHHAQKITTTMLTMKRMQHTGPAVVVLIRVKLLRWLLSTPSGELHNYQHCHLLFFEDFPYGTLGAIVVKVVIWRHFVCVWQTGCYRGWQGMSSLWWESLWSWKGSSHTWYL